MIIPADPRGSSYGPALQTGISGLLEGLAKGKVEKMRHKSIYDTFNAGGYSPEISQILTLLTQVSPKSLATILPMLAPEQQMNQQEQPGMENMQQSPFNMMQQQPEQLNPQEAIRNALLGLPQPQMAQGQQQMPMQQQMQPQQRQPETSQAPQRQTFAQALSRDGQNKKTESVPYKKHLDQLTAGADNLTDMVNTTNRMLKTLDEGIEIGAYPALLASNDYTRSYLDKNTEQFDKDAAHVLNLGQADLKGVASVYRVKTLAKEKPGVGHSVPVNRQIITRLNQQAKAKLANLYKRYPELEQGNPELEEENTEYVNSPEQARAMGAAGYVDPQTGKEIWF